jgi:2-polyprenyl-3-methyl-5-hydroxy-6-metoxy-1,4-benzoquinol methylase
VQRSPVSYRRQQEEVNAYFRAQSSYWKDIYTSSGVQAEIYRMRQAVVLAWIDDLALAPGSRVLEIGCGAGFLSVALAQRGLYVHAIDSAETMVELTRRHAAESGTSELLSVGIGDVCDLGFEDNSFDLVVALGVIPWLERPELAIREMARVSMPGGHVLLTADNRKRLIYLLDPWKNPALTPLRRSIKSILVRIGILHESQGRTKENLYDSHFIDQALANAELIKARGTTLGFGPFTFLGRKFLPKSFDIMLHSRLQHLADRCVSGFHSSGSQYLVLARKLAS